MLVEKDAGFPGGRGSIRAVGPTSGELWAPGEGAAVVSSPEWWRQ